MLGAGLADLAELDRYRPSGFTWLSRLMKRTIARRKRSSIVPHRVVAINAIFGHPRPERLDTRTRVDPIRAH